MQLVVTTWNLQGSRGVDVAAIASHVTGQGSDVLLLQEVQRRQAHRLATALAATSWHWSFKHRPVNTRSEGMAVLGLSTGINARATAVTQRFRWWAWRRRIVQLAQLVTVGTGEPSHPLTLANVHLSPHSAASARDRELATSFRLLAAGGSSTVVVGGDFNDLPDSSLGTTLAARGLRDAWSEAHPEADAEGATNWSSQARHGPPNQRLDYVWVSPDVEVVDASVPRFGEAGFDAFPRLSDHLPLTVTLET